MVAEPLPRYEFSVEEQPQVSRSLSESPQRWWLLLLLFCAMLIGYAHRSALSVAVGARSSSMSADLHLSDAGIGLLLSGFFWIYSFMQLPAGWLADRFGVKRAYSLGFLFWSLTSALTGFVNSFATLLGVRIALGAGQAISFPASSRAVANWFPQRERGTVTGVYLTGVRLGTALVSLLGTFFLARYSWKLFFVVIGLLPLIWLLPWWLFLNRWEPSVGSRTKYGSKQISFWSSLALLRRRSVFGIFLGFFAYDYAWFVFITWLPRYLTKERGFTDSEMAIYSAAPFVIMSAIIVVSGLLSDWFVRTGREERLVRKIFIIVGLAVGCLIVPAGIVGDKMTAVWLLTISLCGLGVCSPNTWTLTQAVCHKKIVGSVSGIQNFGGNLGGILAPALTGFIVHATNSFALALGLVGMVLVVGMIAYWFLIYENVWIENEE
ncbi:MAG TPA: MFS transporter [Pyrinomonadaceae bacterium]|jgi:MFS family permease